MIGITPPWLTRSGRYCLWPPKTRRPRVFLACWIGMRRWAWVIRIVAGDHHHEGHDQEDDLARADLAGAGRRC